MKGKPTIPHFPADAGSSTCVVAKGSLSRGAASPLTPWIYGILDLCNIGARCQFILRHLLHPKIGRFQIVYHPLEDFLLFLTQKGEKHAVVVVIEFSQLRPQSFCICREMDPYCPPLCKAIPLQTIQKTGQGGSVQSDLLGQNANKEPIFFVKCNEQEKLGWMTLGENFSTLQKKQ